MTPTDAPAALAPSRPLPLRFAAASASAGAGILAAALLFPQSTALVSVFLFVLAQAPVLGDLLDRNRHQIWVDEIPPRRANAELARAITVIFLAVLVAYGATALLASPDLVLRWFDVHLAGYRRGTLRDIHFGTFEALAIHNGGVLVICFLSAVLYAHGGMLLVLAWNASLWGVVFGYLTRFTAATDPLGALGALGRALASILPHLLLEALAYIVAAMAGVFLYRGLRRHPVQTAAFRRVLVAVLRLLALAAVILVVAAAVEAHVAPWLVDVTAP